MRFLILASCARREGGGGLDKSVTGTMSAKIGEAGTYLEVPSQVCRDLRVRIRRSEGHMVRGMRVRAFDELGLGGHAFFVFL